MGLLTQILMCETYWTVPAAKAKESVDDVIYVEKKLKS